MTISQGQHGFGRKGLEKASKPAGGASSVFAEVTKFDVTPHPAKMLMVIGISAVAVPLLLVPILQRKGLRLFHFIEFPPSEAVFIFAGLIVFALLGIGIGVQGFVRSFGERVFLTLDNKAICGPRKPNGVDFVRIAYTDIRDAKLSAIQKTQVLVLKSRDGRTIKVGNANFRDDSQWPVFLDQFKHLASRHGGSPSSS